MKLAGQSTFDELNEICVASLPQGGPFIDIFPLECDVDDSGSSAGINLSYMFNQTFGAEIGYVDLGKFTVDYNERGGGNFPFFDTLDIDLRSAYVAGVASYPLSDRLSLTGRLGYYQSDAKLASGVDLIRIDDEGDLYSGASLDYRFADQWSAQLRYDRFDLDVLSLGLKYSFGR